MTTAVGFKLEKKKQEEYVSWLVEITVTSVDLWKIRAKYFRGQWLLIVSLTKNCNLFPTSSTFVVCGSKIETAVVSGATSNFLLLPELS